MSPRRGAALVVDAACALLGRRPVVRAARFALNRARHDGPNQPEANGEHALQRWLLAATPAGRELTVFDVGANRGDWSLALLERTRQAGRGDHLVLHAFEPSEFTCTQLRGRLPAQARVHQLAVSDKERRSWLYVVGRGAGTNSLHPRSGPAAGGVDTEPVTTTTIDGFLRRSGISTVDLLKIDTEGHDYPVLVGARESLRRQAVRVVQFEYNSRWIHARHFLKDVFELVQPLGYRVGKLTPRGIETYPGWDPDLETFVEGNYVAYAAAVPLPAVVWWKQGRPGVRS